MHMADGYARATGKPAVVLVTSEKGATNTLTGIMTAHMDSVPMIVVSGQAVSWMLGKMLFRKQIFGITVPVVKHSYLVKETNDIPRITREAFHIATTANESGLIDIPKDVSAGHLLRSTGGDGFLGYTLNLDVDNNTILQISEAVAKAKRPLILAGHGAMMRADDVLMALAEKTNIPVTSTLLGKGIFPESHRLSLGMLGMHGTAYANKAVCECDLILNVGSRFDDRIFGQPDKFLQRCDDSAYRYRCGRGGQDDSASDYMRGRCKVALDELIKHVPVMENKAWNKHLDGYKRPIR